MGKKMANPPIFYTVGQIRFNPVLNIAEYVPKIHERLRKPFPEVRREELRRLQINVAAQENAEAVTTSAVPRWSFANLKRTAGYYLYADSLVFHTTAYETSTEFHDALIRGIRLVDEVVGLSYIEEVGVRTLDAVIPESGQPIDFYLNRQVLGLHGLLEGELKHNISENVTFVATSKHVARVVILRGSLGLPMDLFPIPLMIDRKFQDLNTLHAILDLDHSRQDRFEFDLEEIGNRIREIKKGVTNVFYKIVTKEALDIWYSQ